MQARLLHTSTCSVLPMLRQLQTQKMLLFVFFILFNVLRQPTLLEVKIHYTYGDTADEYYMQLAIDADSLK